MKRLILFSILMISCQAGAQLVDLMGAMGVQGALANQTTQSAVQTLSMARRVQVLQDLQQTAIQIQTGYMGNYTGVTRQSVLGQPFSGLNWSVGSVGRNQFFIQLNQLDNQTCSYLIGQSVGDRSVEVNGSGNTCSDRNQVRFIFN